MGYVVKATEANGRVTWLAAPSDLTRAHLFGSRDMAKVFATKADPQRAMKALGQTHYALAMESESPPAPCTKDEP